MITRTFLYQNADKNKLLSKHVELFNINQNQFVSLKSGNKAVNEWISVNVGNINSFLLSSMLTQNNDQDFFSLKNIDQINLLDKSLSLESVNSFTELLKQTKLTLYSIEYVELSNCVYTVEYILNDKIYCGYGDNLVIQSGELVFGRKFQGSVGFVRPSFILRNQSKVNQSSKIKTYKVLIEEIDSDEDSYIEYETFLEMEKRGTSDVV